MRSKINYEQLTQIYPNLPKYLSKQISKEQFQNSQTEIKTKKIKLATQKLIIKWFIKQIRNTNQYYKKHKHQDPNKRQSISKIFSQLNKIISKYKKRNSESEKDKYNEIFFNQQNQQFARSNRIFMSQLILDEQKLAARINRKNINFKRNNHVHYIKKLVQIGIEFKQNCLFFVSEQKICKDYSEQNNQNIRQNEQQIQQQKAFNKYEQKELESTSQSPSFSDSFPDIDLESYPTPTFGAIPIILTGEVQSPTSYQSHSFSDSYPDIDLESYPTPTFDVIPIIPTGEIQSQYYSQQKPQNN